MKRSTLYFILGFLFVPTLALADIPVAVTDAFATLTTDLDTYIGLVVGLIITISIARVTWAWIKKFFSAVK